LRVARWALHQPWLYRSIRSGRCGGSECGTRKPSGPASLRPTTSAAPARARSIRVLSASSLPDSSQCVGTKATRWPSTSASPMRPASRSTSAIPSHRGSAVATRTPTGCSAVPAAAARLQDPYSSRPRRNRARAQREASTDPRIQDTITGTSRGVALTARARTEKRAHGFLVGRRPGSREQHTLSRMFANIEACPAASRSVASSSSEVLRLTTLKLHSTPTLSEQLQTNTYTGFEAS